jgi:DNA primase
MTHQKAAPMPGINFAKLREEILMVHVLDLLGFQSVQRRGEQWYGYCPLHESEPQHRKVFSVNVAKNCYYCHKCHSRGDQFRLWSEATKTPIRPATIELCRQLHCEVPWLESW